MTFALGRARIHQRAIFLNHALANCKNLDAWRSDRPDWHLPEGEAMRHARQARSEAE